MSEEEIRCKLEKIPSIKNIEIFYNVNIFDIYLRIVGNEEDIKDILNNIKELDYKYYDFGVFEIWFKSEDSTKVIRHLTKKL